MWGWHAKKYVNKVEMMHESKRIGKAPSLHPFHTKTMPCTYVYDTIISLY